MVIKRTCSFCAGEIEPGTGMMYVKKDGVVFYFCSTACRRDLLEMGRVGHRFKWTRAYKTKKGLEKSRPVAEEKAPAPQEKAKAPKTPAPQVKAPKTAGP
jgi:large subunit ribosomal protein L24e